eukprot:m.113361 g.113361  ORF g.113361 m.113361 type:complete len:597 (+) comp15996_c0_seq1:93-1883(+)
MPKVDIKRDLLFERLGRNFTKEEFEDLCFQFGLELDDVFTEKSSIKKGNRADKEGASEEVIYKLDIPANRYDLLCVEGVVRGIKIFQQTIPSPRYTLSNPAQREKLIIKPDTARVRKFAVAAVLRNVTITQEVYDSLIDLQDKLHQNICRRRTLVAIGTHDLDTVKGPFVYDAQAPKDIRFRPLRAPETREYTAEELMTVYEEDQQLKAYLHIIKGKEVFPVIRDSNGVVLSLPPIINGDHTKITLNTKNIFIECTATDLTKAKVVLNTIVCMFSEHCATPFVIEPVDVVSADGKTTTYPDLAYRVEKVKAAMITKRMGIPASKTPEELAGYLTRMQLTSKVDADKETLLVEIPPTRSDILHECDIWEDCAVAYGFNTIEWTIPKVPTVGKQLPINKLTDQMRHVLAEAGYSEALTFALCKHDDNFKNLRRPDDGRSAVVIANPKTAEFQVARCNLLSGLLKTLSCNSHMALPMKVFEISDVVLKSTTADTGAQNHRRLALVNYNKTSDFDSVQGVVDRVLNMLGVKHRSVAAAGDKTYHLVQSQDPAFFGELGAADIIYDGKRVGVLGVVHPEVLANYQLKNACSAIEMDLEAFL